MNPPRAAAAALLVLALVAACGGDDSDSDGAVEPGPGATTAPDVSKPGNGGTSTNPNPSTDPSATVAPGSPDAKPTAGTSPAELRKATDLADAGVLLAADLPGFTAETQAIDTSDDRAEESLYTCLRAARPTYVARNPGSVWTRGAERISSSADVLKTAKAAKQDIIAAKSGLAPNCFLERLVGELSGPAAANSGSSNRVETTVKGADSAFAIKVTVTITDAQGTAIKRSGYIVGAAVGAVRINVVSLVTGDTEASLADATELAAKAVSRAKSASQS